MATPNPSDAKVLKYLQDNFDPKTGKVKDLSTAIKTLPIQAVITTLTNPAMPADKLKALKAAFSQVVTQMPSSPNPLTIALKKIFGADKTAATAKAPAPTAVKKDQPTLAAMKKPAGPQVTSSGRVVKAPPASARGANLLGAELDDYRSSEDSDFDPNEHSEGDSSGESESDLEEEEVPASKPRPRALASVKSKAKAVSVSSSSEEEEEEDSEEDSESEDSEDCSSTSEEESEEEDTDLEEDNGPERVVLSDKESQELYEKTSQKVQSERQKRNQKMFASWDLIIQAYKGVKDEDIDAETDAEFAFDKMTDDWKCLKKIMKNVFALPFKHTRVKGLPGPDPVILVDDQSEYAAIWLEPQDEGTRLILNSMIDMYATHGVLFDVDTEKCPELAKIKLKELILAGHRARKAGKGKKASK